MPADSAILENPPVEPLLIICWEGFTQAHWWELLRLAGEVRPTLVISPDMRERAVLVMPNAPVVDAGPSLQNLLECIISELSSAT